MTKAAKPGSSRYYKEIFERERAEGIVAGTWNWERKRDDCERALRRHPVVYARLVEELAVLGELLGTDTPRVLLEDISKAGLVGDDGRWRPAPKSGRDLKLAMGRFADLLISGGMSDDPAYAFVVWELCIQAPSHEAAKKQVRDAHKIYLASLQKT